MTLPKKEEDLQRVVEEVAESHPEMVHEHHHHHHAHDIDELLHTIDVLLDAMNTRIADLEEKTTILYKAVRELYKLFPLLVKIQLTENEREKRQVIEEIERLLSKSFEEAKT